MALLLLIPVVLGWRLAQRVLLEEARWALAVLAAPLGLAFTLLGVNGLYRHVSLEMAVLGTLAFETAVIVALLFRKAPPFVPDRLSRSTVIVLALGCLVIYLFTNAQQIANPDDDYWIHAPLQGLMLHDNFPPTNPFFSDIPMNGHYGRNLSIVTIAWLTGGDTFLVQTVMTDLLQVLTFLLFFLAFYRSTGSELQALLGASFVYFGINVGGRAGLMDTLQNNNAYVHLYLALLAYLVLRAWKSGRLAPAVVAGLVLGNYAIVYETHFGLVTLVLVGVSPILAVRERRPALVALTLVTLAVAMPLAFTQGGPLTNLLERRLAGDQGPDPENLSKGMLNQAQVVKVHFPKEHMFQILLETGEYQRISYIYTLDTPLRALYAPSPDRGYRYIWSWDVLRIHFLPLYLMPLSALVLLRRAHPAGLFMGAFGLISFLVPAVVDFGPIYESEYFRWEFAAGLGLAGALGLAAGVLYERFRGRTEGVDWTWEEHPGSLELKLRPKGLAALGLVGLTALNCLACASFFVKRMAEVDDWGGPLRGALLIPSTPAWLSWHAVLDFEPLDYRAARVLEQQVRPGDRLLTNFRQENNFSILFESTLTGVCGARCVGHALPLDDEKIGTTPFHMAAPATAFWATYDPLYLRLLRVNWIFQRGGPDLETVEGVTLVHREEDRSVYRVGLPPLWLASPQAEEAPLEVVSVDLPEHARGGSFTRGELTLRNRSEAVLDLAHSLLTVVPYHVESGQEATPVEWLTQELEGRLAPGEEFELQLPLAPPHEEGHYELRLFWQQDEAARRVAGEVPVLAVDFGSQLRRLELTRAEIRGRQAGTLVPVELELKAPEGFLSGQEVLASLAPYNQEHNQFYLLPGINLVRVPLEVEEGVLRLRLPYAMLPLEPGPWRFDLFLSPEQGEVHRYPGPVIEVVP